MQHTIYMSPDREKLLAAIRTAKSSSLLTIKNLIQNDRSLLAKTISADVRGVYIPALIAHEIHHAGFSRDSKNIQRYLFNETMLYLRDLEEKYNQTGKFSTELINIQKCLSALDKIKADEDFSAEEFKDAITGTLLVEPNFEKVRKFIISNEKFITATIPGTDLIPLEFIFESYGKEEIADAWKKLDASKRNIFLFILNETLTHQHLLSQDKLEHIKVLFDVIRKSLHEKILADALAACDYETVRTFILLDSNRLFKGITTESQFYFNPFGYVLIKYKNNNIYSFLFQQLVRKFIELVSQAECSSEFIYILDSRELDEIYSCVKAIYKGDLEKDLKNKILTFADRDDARFATLDHLQEIPHVSKKTRDEISAALLQKATQVLVKLVQSNRALNLERFDCFYQKEIFARVTESYDQQAEKKGAFDKAVINKILLMNFDHALNIITLLVQAKKTELLQNLRERTAKIIIRTLTEESPIFLLNVGPSTLNSYFFVEAYELAKTIYESDNPGKIFEDLFNSYNDLMSYVKFILYRLEKSSGNENKQVLMQFFKDSAELAQYCENNFPEENSIQRQKYFIENFIKLIKKLPKPIQNNDFLREFFYVFRNDSQEFLLQSRCAAKLRCMFQNRLHEAVYVSNQGLFGKDNQNGHKTVLQCEFFDEDIDLKTDNVSNSYNLLV